MKKSTKSVMLTMGCLYCGMTSVNALESNTNEVSESTVETAETKTLTTTAPKTGWTTINGDTYYINPDGSKYTGFLEWEGNTYFFSRVDGKMRTGYFSIDYENYYFDNDGKMLTGWNK